jgi:GNAT superfamily N-acetyltransferase
MMNAKNFPALTIRARDFNLVAKQPQLLKQLRKLTLYPYSGLNRELDTLLPLSEQRRVKCQVLLAYQSKKLVAWALFSKEESSMRFAITHRRFQPHDGILFEVYVHPDYRRQGIASEMMKVARRKAGAFQLCVCPWDERSRAFYDTFCHYNAKWL